MYSDIVCVLYMNPISIWTRTWSIDGNRVHVNILAVIESEVELGAVPDVQSLNGHIVALKES